MDEKFKEILEKDEMFSDLFYYFTGQKNVMIEIFPKDKFKIGEEELKKLMEYAELVKKFTDSKREIGFVRFEIGSLIIIIGGEEHKLPAYVQLIQNAWEKGREEFERTIGRILGYPECCIEKYVKERDIGEIIKNYIFESFSKYDFLIVTGSGTPIGLWYVGTRKDINYFSPILSYIPCRPGCEKAIRDASIVLINLVHFIYEKFKKFKKENEKKNGN